MVDRQRVFYPLNTHTHTHTHTHTNPLTGKIQMGRMAPKENPQSPMGQLHRCGLIG
jgi:hypothetical protein